MASGGCCGASGRERCETFPELVQPDFNNNAQSTNPIMKVVLVGDAGVGKSGLINRYCNDSFTETYKSTIGADFTSKQITIGSEKATLQLWDTAGQERFKSLGIAFYRGSDACVLVYDVHEKKSFERLANWRLEFIHQAGIDDPTSFPFIVIGNKIDIESPGVGAEAQVTEWCKHMGNIPWIWVSAKTGEKVEEAFMLVYQGALAHNRKRN